MRISPPSRRAISRLIDRPRPVPPYLRLVVPSACWNSSKTSRSLSSGMPMPVSVTLKAIPLGPGERRGREPHALRREADRQRHAALVGELHGVGQQVLEDLLEPLLVGDE